MPRRNVPSRRKAAAEPQRAGGSGGAERTETWRGEHYRVRAVSGANSTGPYRCPGCDQLLANLAHVVAWPADDLEAGDRRHWHTGCWAARNNRSPAVQRSRNAPRYG
ncbi:MAG: hypothetical protein M3Y42_11370 [Actinomycetota bacterium]|nr:hypothetical protein [Actinomycetota bacterium]MDQ2957552.1 hypothetical protein [Actinomycetota bacterium]